MYEDAEEEPIFFFEHMKQEGIYKIQTFSNCMSRSTAEPTDIFPPAPPRPWLEGGKRHNKSRTVAVSPSQPVMNKRGKERGEKYYQIDEVEDVMTYFERALVYFMKNYYML